MKKFFSTALLFAFALTTFTSMAQDNQDKSKRPSPPATATATTNNGVTIMINYSQPSLKGRTIGKDVEPMQGKVWRAGANEATTFEVNKDVTINGQKLPAGKYALFMKDNGNDWTVIFNKVWNTWGAFDYEKNKGEDVLQVNVPVSKSSSSTEKLIYTVDKSGKVTLMWGDKQVSFTVK
ncbi:MAG: DUF2911 domain-containing protein [Ilyomonas sp.]